MKAIILVTLKEAVRKKTFLVMTILSGLYMILWTLVVFYANRTINSFGEIGGASEIAGQMLMQMGLSFSSLILSLLTIMLAAGSVSADIENGMVHAIISRPIRRSSYIFGRFLGFALLSAVYATILFFAMLLVGSIFSMEAVKYLTASQIAVSWLQYTLVPVVLVCLTMFGSTFMKTVPNGLMMIFVYILGNIAGTLEMIGGIIQNEAVKSTGIFISLISPFNTLYSEAQNNLLASGGLMNDMMSTAGGLSGSGEGASTLMFVYIGIYACGLLAIAARRFVKRDI